MVVKLCLKKLFNFSFSRRLKVNKYVNKLITLKYFILSKLFSSYLKTELNTKVIKFLNYFLIFYKDIADLKYDIFQVYNRCSIYSYCKTLAVFPAL